METKKVILDYVKQELLNDDSAELSEEDNLLTEGMIDSIGIMRLVGFMEESLGITIPAEDVTLENFQSVSSMSSYVEQRKAP